METNAVNTMEIKVVEPKTFFYNEGTTTLNKIHDYVNTAVGSLRQEAERTGLEITGPMEFIYLDATGDMDKEFTLQIALPVNAEKPCSEGFYFKNAGEFKCLSYEYLGDVSKMYPAYDMLFGKINADQLQPNNEIREVYVQWEHLTSENNITEIQIGLN